MLSTYDWDLRDLLWWPQERPVPMQLLGGLSGFLSRQCRALGPCVESVSDPEDSSPVLTWILGVLYHKGSHRSKKPAYHNSRVTPLTEAREKLSPQ